MNDLEQLHQDKLQLESDIRELIQSFLDKYLYINIDASINIDKVSYSNDIYCLIANPKITVFL